MATEREDEYMDDSAEGGRGEEESMDEHSRAGDDVTYPAIDYPALPQPDFVDWNYVMRRECQEIIPGLSLGPYASATRAALPQMKAKGFTHVVCVREIMERQFIRPNHMEHFRYLVIELSDTMHDNIIPHLREVNGFLDDCLNGGGRALVHGNGGNSRSAALVMGYLMWRFGVSAANAHVYVQQRRFSVCPSDGFLAQLREYEPIVKAVHLVPKTLPSMSNKRQLEDDDDGKKSFKDQHQPSRGDLM